MAPKKDDMNDVDCMTCLIQHANGLPPGGTHVDSAGVTHSTLRWVREVVVVCTLAHDDWNGDLEWHVTDQTVRL